MPLYSYRCHECEHEFEDMRRVDDRLIPESEPCPSCSTSGVRVALNASMWVDAYKLGLVKPKGDFVERMTGIKKKTPKNTIEF